LKDEGAKMCFQRARSDEHVQQRIEEIISATLKIYDSIGYEGLSFSAISELTKFTRPTIYKYFKTKEEILLKILASDVETWIATLVNSFKLNKLYSLDEIAEIWVDAITQNYRLLNLYSILFTSIEKNVSLEALAEFKRDSLKFQTPMLDLLKQLFPKAAIEDISNFIINQLALAHGLYPMSQLSELQLEALKLSKADFAAIDFKRTYKASIYQLMYCLEKRCLK
jgi:AcrR family transcriptional regulator